MGHYIERKGILDFVEMAKRFADECWSAEDVKEVLAPQGEKTYSVRIPGTGRMILMLNDESECRIVNSRNGEKELVGWGDIGTAWLQLMQLDKEPEARWTELYCRPYPKKTEVAPVQPKKESKVTKAKPEKRPKPESKKEVSKENPPVQQEPENMTLHEIQRDIPAPNPILEEKPGEEHSKPDEKSEEQQLPRQDSIENHPEYMPDEPEKEEKEPEITENEQKSTGDITENAENSMTDNKNINRGYKSAIANNLNNLQNLWNSGDPHRIEKMISILDDLHWRLKKVEEIEDTENEED